jgi:hypothetical protein
MASRQRGPKVVAWVVGGAELLGLAAVVPVAAALAGPSYAVPAGILAGVLGLAGVWGAQRVRARHRLRAVLDSFANRELARQR